MAGSTKDATGADSLRAKVAAAGLIGVQRRMHTALAARDEEAVQSLLLGHVPGPPSPEAVLSERPGALILQVSCSMIPNRAIRLVLLARGVDAKRAVRQNADHVVYFVVVARRTSLRLRRCA